VIFTDENVENYNISMVNYSHKDEIPVPILSNEGSEVVKWQRGDSDRSETTEEIESTGEQEERRSEILANEYREDSTVIKCHEMINYLHII
jgi:hypothetical protein